MVSPEGTFTATCTPVVKIMFDAEFSGGTGGIAQVLQLLCRQVPNVLTSLCWLHPLYAICMHPWLADVWPLACRAFGLRQHSA